MLVLVFCFHPVEVRCINTVLNEGPDVSGSSSHSCIVLNSSHTLRDLFSERMIFIFSVSPDLEGYSVE